MVDACSSYISSTPSSYSTNIYCFLSGSSNLRMLAHAQIVIAAPKYNAPLLVLIIFLSLRVLAIRSEKTLKLPISPLSLYCLDNPLEFWVIVRTIKLYFRCRNLLRIYLERTLFWLLFFTKIFIYYNKYTGLGPSFYCTPEASSGRDKDREWRIILGFYWGLIIC